VSVDLVSENRSADNPKKRLTKNQKKLIEMQKRKEKKKHKENLKSENKRKFGISALTILSSSSKFDGLVLPPTADATNSEILRYCKLVNRCSALEKFDAELLSQKLLVQRKFKLVVEQLMDARSDLPIVMRELHKLSQ
jgi:hypothetical protein